MLQIKGPCAFGRLNHYLGKQAAERALFPDTDFCVNPEAVCGASLRHELIWMSGLFYWIDHVQSYDRGGFVYMDELRAFADGGMSDDEFIKRVAAIVQVGCHDPPCESAGCLHFPCDGAYPLDLNYVESVRKVFRILSELSVWELFPETPGGTIAPTPAPTLSPSCVTNCTEFPSSSPLAPTANPSKEPFTPPTSVPSEPPSRIVDARISFFGDISTYLKRRRAMIESEIFVSKSNFGQQKSTLYTLDGFLDNLRVVATGGFDGMIFYIGQGRGGDFTEGLVNIALFLAHAMTRGILWDTCEEVNNHLIDGKLPLSKSRWHNIQTYHYCAHGALFS